jgi:uncharacterized coiled-coil DUF342 family protein
MNKERRKAIGALLEQIAELQGKADDIKEQLESLKDEEQEYYDNMPESFQNGEKGEAANAAVEALENLLSDIETFTELNLDDAQNAIN